MPPRLRAHSIAAAEPTRAAHQTAAAVLSDAPRSRPLLLAVTSLGAHPGLRPSPWVLDGVLRAIEHDRFDGRSLLLGERDELGGVADRLAAAGLPPATDDRSALGLRPPGSHRELRIPRSWVGSDLCLVVPCLHRQLPRRSGRPTWRGPVALALLALAGRLGVTAGPGSLELVTRTLSELFAHISVVVDASWWAPLSSEDEGAPVLLAPERALGLRLPSSVSSSAAIDPRHADGWLGHQLGLVARPSGDAPVLEGPAAKTPWPKLSRRPAPATRQRPGLAGQAVSALWRRTDRGPARRSALPPAAPGALAELWHEYERGARPR